MTIVRGQDHGRAVLTDEEVDHMRNLWDSEQHISRHKRYWTMDRLAEKFEISRRQVVNIVGYIQRASRGD